MEEQNIEKLMKNYGKPHRMFVQAMLTRGIISSRDLKELFELICKRCDIELPADTAKLTKAFYFAINMKIYEKCNLKLVKVFDEANIAKNSFLLLVNKTDRSKDDNKLTIKDQTTFPPHEMEYLKLIVDNIMENPLREVTSTRALSISKDVNKNNKKIPAQEAEVILQKFKDHNWLAECQDSGAILLSTRFIYEMEPYLKEIYPDNVGTCAKCKKMVIRGIYCSNEDCESQYHIYCAHEKKEKIKCVKCKLELTDRTQEISQHKRVATKRKRAREESTSESD